MSVNPYDVLNPDEVRVLAARCAHLPRACLVQVPEEEIDEGGVEAFDSLARALDGLEVQLFAVYQCYTWQD